MKCRRGIRLSGGFSVALALAGAGAITMAVALSIGASTAQARIKYVRSPTLNLPDGGRGSAKARCPRGMHVLGGGQNVFSAPREATLATSTPFDNARPEAGAEMTAGSPRWTTSEQRHPEHPDRLGDLWRLQAELREGFVSRGRR